MVTDSRKNMEGERLPREVVKPRESTPTDVSVRYTVPLSKEGGRPVSYAEQRMMEEERLRRSELHSYIRKHREIQEARENARIMRTPGHFRMPHEWQPNPPFEDPILWAWEFGIPDPDDFDYKHTYGIMPGTEQLGLMLFTVKRYRVAFLCACDAHIISAPQMCFEAFGKGRWFRVSVRRILDERPSLEAYLHELAEFSRKPEREKPSMYFVGNPILTRPSSIIDWSALS